jgi:ABC-type dipeptide/oligopeptide/nickel transport system permease subunit
MLVACLLAIAVFGTSRDPTALDIEHGLSALGAPLPPSLDHVLGTDPLGRDVWARVVAATATSLEVAALSTALALALGLGVGLVAGYAGGWLDAALMRLVDLVLAFPLVLLAILLAALLRATSLAPTSAPVVLTLGLVGWTTTARVIRGKVAGVVRGELVTAVRALGARPGRIVLHHLLPNVAGIATALAALTFAQNLLAESVLSFVGLGPPPPAASWGRMLFEARAYYRSAPWLAIAPGVAISLAVAAFHLVGEGLRDALDPRSRA